MEALRIVRPGLLTTVQDLGRSGQGRYGVPVGGALDTLSFRLANLLLGNDPGAAGLEMTLDGPSLEALSPLTCACVGADMAAALNGRPVGAGTAFRMLPGDLLQLGTAREGARCYLAVRGGFDAPVVLGSRSVLTSAASYESFGRALRAGDILRALPPRGPAPVRCVPPGVVPRAGRVTTLRVTEGPQAEELRAAVSSLLARTWTVSGDVSRMGLRLSGAPIEVELPGFDTEGSPPGSVQLPPGGEPILLLAEGPVTGGYPKPVVVISADLPLAGQLRSGDRVRFMRVTADEAVSALRTQEEALRRLFETGTAGTRFDPGPLRWAVELLEGSSVTELRIEQGDERLHWERGTGR